MKLLEAELVDVASQAVGGSWEDDFSAVAPQLEATEPCYILYRLDSTNNLGYEWALFTYVPDKAKVRQKMVYSSTKASLKMSLGGGRFSQEIHGTVPVRSTYLYYSHSPSLCQTFLRSIAIEMVALKPVNRLAM
jgi:hypothetical protein